MGEIESMVCALVRSKSLSFSEGIIDRKGAQTTLYLTCTIMFSVDLAHYGVFVLKIGGRVSADCGTIYFILECKFFFCFCFPFNYYMILTNLSC